jgi:hypothetical protein
MKITLCGSTKYRDQFENWNRRLSKAGHIVYSVSSFMHAGDPLTDAEKETLDLVHLRKIVESDAIFVVGWDHEAQDVYVGDSTRREMAWARMWGKQVLQANPNASGGYVTVQPYAPVL